MALRGAAKVSADLLKNSGINPFRRLMVCRTVTNYKFLKPFEPTHKAEFEVSKDPEEWKYVERLLPKKFVPTPEPKPQYLSGWKPPNPPSQDLPYFIPRTKNHMVPVYLTIRKRGTQKITAIRHVRGDVWAMEKDIRTYVKGQSGKDVGMKIDEVNGNVFIRGDFVHYVNNWISEKGF